MGVHGKLHEADAAKKRRANVASEILERTICWGRKCFLIHKRGCFLEKKRRLEQLVAGFIVDLAVNEEDV